MIEIIDKHNCCGCLSCVERCPHQCISMKTDEEGFSYPVVDQQLCVHCDVCDSVCPVINQGEVILPIKIFASKNKDKNVLLKSSSGGVFSVIAERIIEKGGVVFGACFDEKWNVVTKYTETKEGLEAFKGSKYVQCNVGNTFSEAEQFLKVGRSVLYSGTPCQIAGLNKFLRKEYDNLITISIICHGAPSPGVWKKYLKTISEKMVPKNKVCFTSSKPEFEITSINFRDKKNGWKEYGFSVIGKIGQSEVYREECEIENSILYEYHQRNVYFRGFLHNLYLRPSCYKCPARKGKSGADIQLGDYWGVLRRTPEFYDPLGVSLVLLYTNKGYELFKELDLLSCRVNYDDVLDCNENVEIDEVEPSNRRDFFDDFNLYGFKAVTKYCDKIDGHGFIWYLKSYLFRMLKLIKK